MALLKLATIALAGPIGENVWRTGQSRLIDVVEAGGTTDFSNARTLVDLAATSTEEAAKLFDLVLLRARSSVHTHQGAIRRVAEALAGGNIIMGDRIRHLVNGTTPIDPTKHYTVVEGKRVTLRRWAEALDLNHHDRQRAVRALQKETR